VSIVVLAPESLSTKTLESIPDLNHPSVEGFAVAFAFAVPPTIDSA
jgi:hypothetical protein